MKAMILAAGLGERMRPLTDGRAKPSLPVLNRPLISLILDFLKRHGVTEAMINLHHCPDSIRGILGDGRRIGLKVSYSEETLILGTAGGLKKVEGFFRGSGTFILINGDFLTDCDLGAALKAHREAGATATMVLAPVRPEMEYGIVEVDDRGNILRIAGLPAGQPSSDARHFNFIGLHILEPAILDAIPAGRKVEINREVYPGLIQGGKTVKGFIHAGFWREMGTPRLYLDGSLALLRSAAIPPPNANMSTEGIYLDQATLPEDAVVSPPVLIGKGTTVGAGCSLLGGVVIGRQSILGRGCALRSTIIWDGGRVGDGAALTDCIVTSGVYVPPGTSVSGKIIFRVEGYQGKKERLERLGGCWMSPL